MKRLLGTVLGLLCTRVCCELGLSQMRVCREYCWGSGEKLLMSLADFLLFSWFMGAFSVWFFFFVGVILTITMTISVFLVRCERAASGAESSSLESPGRSQFHTVVQLFQLCDQCAVVSPKFWGPTHQPVLHSFRDKVEWKLKCYEKGPPQFIVYFLFSDHRLSHLFLCCGATALLRHLQPVHKLSAGLSSSPNHNHVTGSPHSIFTAQYSKPTLAGF